MLLLVLLLTLTPNTRLVSAHYSLPEDIFSYPKWAVHFLNRNPINPADAARFSKGLGTLDQFLSRTELSESSPELHAILDTSDDDHELIPPQSFQFMRLDHERAFLCHLPIPSPPPPPPPEDTNELITPERPWQQLASLAGSCLYHRQGWFTYSYCHNLHVRQFRELAHSQQQAALSTPEEDNDYESFTLGRSPTADLTGELILSEEAVHANQIEVARGARQRYLLQRWRDGTVCDKTGTQREIEVQFHCSPSSMDAIVLVKEISTCKYVLVINTPRLCGEPGFKSRAEHGEESPVRCREITDDPRVDSSVVDSPYPRRITSPKALSGPEKAMSERTTAKPEKRAEKPAAAAVDNDDKISLLKKLLENMIHSKKRDGQELSVVSIEEDENGQQFIVLEQELTRDEGIADNDLSDEVDDFEPQHDVKHEEL